MAVRIVTIGIPDMGIPPGQLPGRLVTCTAVPVGKILKARHEYDHLVIEIELLDKPDCMASEWLRWHRVWVYGAVNLPMSEDRFRLICEPHTIFFPRRDR